jgi:hypothetical protein
VGTGKKYFEEENIMLTPGRIDMIEIDVDSKYFVKMTSS